MQPRYKFWIDDIGWPSLRLASSPLLPCGAHASTHGARQVINACCQPDAVQVDAHKHTTGTAWASAPRDIFPAWESAFDGAAKEVAGSGGQPFPRLGIGGPCRATGPAQGLLLRMRRFPSLGNVLSCPAYVSRHKQPPHETTGSKEIEVRCGGSRSQPFPRLGNGALSFVPSPVAASAYGPDSAFSQPGKRAPRTTDELPPRRLNREGRLGRSVCKRNHCQRFTRVTDWLLTAKFQRTRFTLLHVASGQQPCRDPSRSSGQRGACATAAWSLALWLSLQGGRPNRVSPAQDRSRGCLQRRPAPHYAAARSAWRGSRSQLHVMRQRPGRRRRTPRTSGALPSCYSSIDASTHRQRLRCEQPFPNLGNSSSLQVKRRLRLTGIAPGTVANVPR
jgi:hypothetical protein